MENVLNTLRELYKQSVGQQQAAEKLWKRVKNYNGKEGIIFAYKGAAKALVASYDWNPLNKYLALHESMKYFQKAIELAPRNIEVRFLRFAVQHNIPEFLGMSNHLSEDKKILGTHISEYSNYQLSKSDVEYILAFLASSNRYSSKELHMLKQKIAS